MASPFVLRSRVALIIAASSAFLGATIAGEGNLQIRVLDQHGKPIPSATVIVASPSQIGGARRLQTDHEGRVRFIRLAPGEFSVQASAEGLISGSLSKVPVKPDQTTAAELTLKSTAGATVEVVDSVRLVDTTTVTSGTQLTSESLEGLPIRRDLLANIALAPGVFTLPTNTTSGTANPGLLFGLNRTSGGSSSGGTNGARNNTYLIDGVDVTNPETGTARTQLPRELIQVQDIKTGGITAEYSARAGLFSNVTTKIGGNEFEGGISIDYRAPQLQNGPQSGRLDMSKHRSLELNSWVMGPIIKDKLWFVFDAQKVDDTLQVTPPSTNALYAGETRTGTVADATQVFGKLTWQVTPKDQASFSYNRDPLTSDTLTSTSVRTNRGDQYQQGGSRYLASYTHQFDKLILDIRASQHQEENSTLALYSDEGPLNNILSDTAITGNEKYLGNSSSKDVRKDTRKELRADLTWLFDALGSHTLKVGIQIGQEELARTTSLAQGASYESYIRAVTWGNTAAYGGNVNSFKNKIISAINADSSLMQSLVDAGYTPTGTGGTFQSTDLNNYTFDTANPYGGYNSYRNVVATENPSKPKMDKLGFYLQDQWQLGRFTFSPGLRFDKYQFIADNGTKLFDTGFNLAPRVGLTWDVKGDGRSKGYAYYGRYVDPIKLDMVRFTGSLTSSVQQEQVYLLDQWVTFNTRGGTKTVDAVFADNFKLPKTDELRMGYSQELSTNLSLEVAYTWRRDFDIVEDFDITLYTDKSKLESEARSVYTIVSGSETTAQLHAIDLYRNLYIDPSYFAGGGYTGTQNVTRAKNGQLNYMLANLPGGERRYRSLEVTLNRKDADHWSGFATFSLVSARGNSYSSGDAGRQGDNAQWDPRLPYMNGRLAGSIAWAFKAYGSYHWDNGLSLGANFTSFSGFAYAHGITGGGLEAAPAVDQIDKQRQIYWTPNIYQLDLRVTYARNLYQRVRGEVYGDIFNALNRQSPTGLAESTNLWGAAPVKDTPYQYQAPRSLVLGAKLTF